MFSDLGVEILKLGIAVRMVAAFHRLGWCLQAIPGLVQQGAHHALADRVSLLMQDMGELTRAFARPAQRRHRIATGVGIDQSFQVPHQRGVVLATLLPSAACLSNARSGGVLQFIHAPLDSWTRDARCPRHTGDAATPQRACLRRQEQAALLLVQSGQDRRQLLCQLSVIVHRVRMPSCTPICQSYFIAGSLRQNPGGTAPRDRWTRCGS